MYRDWVLKRVGSRLLVAVADRKIVLTAGTSDRDNWGVVTDDPALVVLGLETIVHYIVSDVLIAAMGPTEFLELWESDTALMRLGTGAKRRARTPDARAEGPDHRRSRRKPPPVLRPV